MKQVIKFYCKYCKKPADCPGKIILSLGQQFRCTRLKGHKDDHVACGSKHKLIQWKQGLK